MNTSVHSIKKREIEHVRGGYVDPKGRDVSK